MMAPMKMESPAIDAGTALGSREDVLLHHAFRNTLIPLVTMIGLTLPVLLSGSIILEQIFRWPGMGKLFFESIRERDYPTMMGLILMFSVLTLLGQKGDDHLLG
jgi:peptide/nickel transport system permease protein